MRLTLIVIAGGLLLLTPVQSRAETGGCLKYGAAGAIAGHAVGHGVKGALAGCVTGMVVRHESRKMARRRAAQARLNPPASGLNGQGPNGQMPAATGTTANRSMPITTGQQGSMAPR